MEIAMITSQETGPCLIKEDPKMGNSLTLSKMEHVGVITLENPKKRNSINSKLINEMSDALNGIEADNDIRVIIITGSGDSFCAGYDISELAPLKTGSEYYPKGREVQDLFLKIENMKKPIIAAINGLAMGGGLEMSMVCDIRIAAESAVFALPEVHVGLLPAAGGMTRLPRLVGVGKAKELIYTGRRFSAEEACQIGLLNKVVPADQLMNEVMKTASVIAGCPPLSIAVGKFTINQNLDASLYSATINEVNGIVSLWETEDAQEGLRAFVEKRKPVFKGR